MKLSAVAGHCVLIYSPFIVCHVYQKSVVDAPRLHKVHVIHLSPRPIQTDQDRLSIKERSRRIPTVYSRDLPGRDRRTPNCY